MLALTDASLLTGDGLPQRSGTAGSGALTVAMMKELLPRPCRSRFYRPDLSAGLGMVEVKIQQ